MQEESHWHELDDDTDLIIQIIREADEPLTVHQIIQQMAGMKTEWRTNRVLEGLIDEGIVEHGPPETDDGLLGLVNQEPTYQLAKPGQDN